MTDSEFLQALESCTLPAADFGHAGHVRACYLYLRSRDFIAALGRTRSAIRGYAASLGKPERYHETITVAYVALIQEHLDERGDGGGWTGFAKNNRELFERDLLSQFYAPGQLDSDRARRVFVLPRPREESARLPTIAPPVSSVANGG